MTPVLLPYPIRYLSTYLQDLPRVRKRTNCWESGAGYTTISRPNVGAICTSLGTTVVLNTKLLVASFAIALLSLLPTG